MLIYWTMSVIGKSDIEFIINTEKSNSVSTSLLWKVMPKVLIPITA